MKKLILLCGILLTSTVFAQEDELELTNLSGPWTFIATFQDGRQNQRCVNFTSPTEWEMAPNWFGTYSSDGKGNVIAIGERDSRGVVLEGVFRLKRISLPAEEVRKGRRAQRRPHHLAVHYPSDAFVGEWITTRKEEVPFSTFMEATLWEGCGNQRPRR